ncbi:NmrA/HSCARG family protein [Mycolicibacterium flavescens]|uniref:Nucleoside-diphosphate sugar epimerase n=1 Tax=Mycolicibacterium flavescens TaxID=1776 RepID=A0A1E3RLG4_MYCFV|nr:NmrA/HSCARG family protein [Mycolicibacterium flavescens]MCV7281943.1 NmrA/HSCARG family protein [Mycolicibacterium flavescens]ODQ90688.1 nucleoside-diphosphate sugar epimerase [Mycolicibacterium flavescens]
MTTNVIAVVGATGKQGGGLVRAILDDPAAGFRARALTRDPDSERARQLAEAGAEVVAADLDDLDSMTRAFAGVAGAFVVTNYWAPRTPEEEAARTRADAELQQAETAARAAKTAGVPHVIWSTLEDTRDHFGDDERVPTVEGRYKVPHFDAKAEADSLFTKHGVPATFLRTTGFFEGFTRDLAPVRDQNGELVLTLPMADRTMAAIAVDDIGRTALGIFKRGAEFIGATVSIAGDHLTGEQIAAELATLYGEPVAYRPQSWDEFRSLPFPVAVEMGNMFQFYAEDSERFVGARDLDFVRTLNPGLLSFHEWVHQQGHQQPRAGATP